MAIDLTIRGAGVFGLAIAYECARRGARVRVIEHHAIGAGASGGVVGALAPHVPELWEAKKAFQLDSLLMSARFWAGVEATSGLATGYGRVGRLQGLPDEAALDLARQRAQAATTLWRGQAEWRVVQWPDGWCPPSATGWWVHDTLSARIDPRRACAALAEALRALGGELVIGAAATRGALIWATGVAGLEDLSRDLGRDLGAGEKGQALLLAHDAGAAPQVQVDGVHIVPHDNGTVAIGSTTERSFASATATDHRLEMLLQRAVAALPVLAAAKVLERWAGLRPRSATRSPVLGHWPGRPGQYVANGGFKIGFGVAPRIAEMMADLVLAGSDSIPDAFRLADVAGEKRGFCS